MLLSLIHTIPLSITTQALLLGVTIGAISYQIFRKKYKLPPGPWPLPLLGNILSLRTLPIYKVLVKWKAEYGPVVTMYFGPIRCVTLNSPEVVNEALVKKGADFAGRQKMHSIEILSNGYKDIAFADISPEWKILRKVALQGLRQYLSGNKLETKLFQSASKVMKNLKDEEGKVIDVEKYMSLLVFDLLHGVCFNKSFQIDDKQFLDLLHTFEETNKDFGNGVWEDIIPLLKYFPTKRFTRLISSFQVFLDFIADECKVHHEHFSEDNMMDLTDFMICALKQEDDPEAQSLITNEHIVQTLSDIFSAGTDTSRQTLTWTILLLASNPDIQQKLHEELDQVLGAGQAPTIKDRERLPYTEAVLHESMRYCPVAPMGIPHSTRCDTTVGEYEIPKDTMVMINHWALHNDPDVWGDPDIFRPERFLDEDGKLAPKTMSWLPFSAGRRNCLGETIARPELHLLLAVLLRNFTFSCPEGKSIDLTPVGSITFLPPKNELIAIARK